MYFHENNFIPSANSLTSTVCFHWTLTI